MLDDQSFIAQRDPSNALQVAADEWRQLQSEVIIENIGEVMPLRQVIVSGMGGSALAAGMVNNWLNITIPFVVSRKYELPSFASPETLAIISSYSGNTEETVSALQHAEQVGARIVVIASGGQLEAIAREKNYPLVLLPKGLQPRMAVFYNLRALAKILNTYDVQTEAFDELATYTDWLKDEIAQWLGDVPTTANYAKQLALKTIGKTPVIYAGEYMAPVAYKWKISFNENAKNVAFWNEFPEFNHNEFIGWTGHPVEKPFAIFNLLSQFEHPQVQKRFSVSDTLLSGQRPHAQNIELKGDSVIAQMLWGCVLADFVSIYTAILNGVDPTPVALIEKFKKALQ